MIKQVSIFILLVFLAVNVFCESPVALWHDFLESSDSEEKAEILINLGDRAKGNQTIIFNINNYLSEMNTLFISGTGVDYIIVSACIAALMELGDVSSYPVLFSVLRSGFPEVIASEVYGALDFIPGNLFQFLSGIIENNPPEEKFAAFKAGVNSERLSISERGQLAELALSQGLSAGEENIDMAAMRYASVEALATLRWTRANQLAIKHYYRVLTDYLQQAVSKNRLVEAIACLGSVGNSEAALALGLQLGLINVRTESTGLFDSEITLAIIQALGQIGDNAAFDHLIYASNLSYGENITAAAREAINRLRW